MTVTRTLPFVVAASIALWLTPELAVGQAGQAELRGVISDESGAVLPGASVTATHKETGATRTTVTSENGTYLMPALPIGTYDIKVELSGFATLVREGQRLGVGESAVVGFAMKLASLAETLTVTGEAPLVDVTQSDLGGRVQTAQIESLPLSGRNWLELVSLVPGARGNPGTVGAGSSGNDASRYQWMASPRPAGHGRPAVRRADARPTRHDRPVVGASDPQARRRYARFASRVQAESLRHPLNEDLTYG